MVPLNQWVNIVSRMAELRTMAADITKNDGDIENYSKEFRELQSQLSKMSREKFNGIRLFSDQDTVEGGGVGHKGARKSECHGTEAYADGKTGFDDTYKKVSFRITNASEW